MIYYVFQYFLLWPIKIVYIFKEFKKCVHTDLKTILVPKYLDTKQDTAVVSDK